MRECKVRLSKDCKFIFKTKSKRAQACLSCKKYLSRLGLNVETVIKLIRIIKGNKEVLKLIKEPVTESIEWHNSKEGTITVIENIDVNNERGVKVGIKEVKITAKATVDDIENGIRITKERIAKNNAEIDKISKQLESLGKAPVLSNEIVRLKKNLELLQKIEQSRQLKRKVVPLNEQIEQDKKFIENRSKLLETRPKA